MAASLPIPQFQTLAEIYPGEVAQKREGLRWNALINEFKQTYDASPTHVIRAPGRVNILGEHIDYSLFPVLPAAIEQDILIALLPRKGKTVRLGNVLSTFKTTSFDMTHQTDGNGWHVDFISPKDGGGWDNYVKVALQEGLEEYFKDGKDKLGEEPTGMDLLVSGTVPPGSGLSSSAAFVVGSVIMFLVADNLTSGVSKGDIVQMAMNSEHRMGLRTGGMDQAASALCLQNTLLHLSFFPTLHPVPLPLPASLAVVITNSLAPHELTQSAPEQYNLRVVEVLIATRLLLHAWGLDESPSLKGHVGEQGRMWLREALELWQNSGALGSAAVDEKVLYEKGLEEVDRVLGAQGKDTKGWTKEEMIEASGMNPDAFSKTFLQFLEIRATYFHLHRRLTHTLLESLRVLDFSTICHSLPLDTPESDPSLMQLGSLLDQSHYSCKDVYECTCTETDALQVLCKAKGAVGSRQTGGGWGGAVISMVKVSEVQGFLERIRASYGPYQGLSDEAVDAAAFATLPGSGAGIYAVQDGPVI